MQEQIEIQLDRIIVAIPEILGAIVALIILVLLGRLASNGVSKVLNRTSHRGVKQTRLVVRTIRWGFNIIGLVIALNVLGLRQVATSFLAAGGVMAVVLGFAFREIGENLLAGFFLSFSRSFDVGDLIESSGMRGIVKRIEIRDVHIRTSDGCDIFIPSATIYKNPLFNYTRDGLRRAQFTIGIDYGDDPQAAREVMKNTISQNKYVLEKPAAVVQINGFNPSYIELAAYFWIDTFNTQPGIGEIKSQVMKDCRKTLADNGYTFSSNVTTGIDMNPVQVKLNQE